MTKCVLLEPVTVNVTDNGDGTYSVTYKGTTATSYSVQVTSNGISLEHFTSDIALILHIVRCLKIGTNIKDSPWPMTIKPASVDPTQCNASGSLHGGVAGRALDT